MAASQTDCDVHIKREGAWAGDKFTPSDLVSASDIELQRVPGMKLPNPAERTPSPNLGTQHLSQHENTCTGPNITLKSISHMGPGGLGRRCS